MVNVQVKILSPFLEHASMKSGHFRSDLNQISSELSPKYYAVVILAMSEQILAAYMSTNHPALHRIRFNTVKITWNQ